MGLTIIYLLEWITSHLKEIQQMVQTKYFIAYGRRHHLRLLATDFVTTKEFPGDFCGHLLHAGDFCGHLLHATLRLPKIFLEISVDICYMQHSILQVCC